MAHFHERKGDVRVDNRAKVFVLLGVFRCVLEGFSVAGKGLYVLTWGVIIISLLLLLGGDDRVALDELLVLVLLGLYGCLLYFNKLCLLYLGIFLFELLINLKRLDLIFFKLCLRLLFGVWAIFCDSIAWLIAL